MLFAATGGILLLYIVNIVMRFFGAEIGFIHSNGLMGIGFSLVVVAIAALNLVLDFDFIEQGGTWCSKILGSLWCLFFDGNSDLVVF